MRIQKKYLNIVPLFCAKIQPMTENSNLVFENVFDTFTIPYEETPVTFRIAFMMNASGEKEHIVEVYLQKETTSKEKPLSIQLNDITLDANPRGYWNKILVMDIPNLQFPGEGRYNLVLVENTQKSKRVIAQSPLFIFIQEQDAEILSENEMNEPFNNPPEDGPIIQH